MLFRLILAGLLSLTVGLGLNGCSIGRFDVMDSYIHHRGLLSKTFTPMEVSDISDNYQARPAAFADLVLQRFVTAKDPYLVRLGYELSALPEINDGVSPEEAEALRTIDRMIREMSPGQRARLIGKTPKKNNKPRVEAWLQGLFWMAEGGELDQIKLLNYRHQDFFEYAWGMLPLRVRTPEQTLDFLTKNFTYAINPYSVQPKKEFFRSRYGDCTEFTLLAGYLLKLQGYDVKILLSRPTNVMGHASVIYGDGRQYRLMDASRITARKLLAKKRAVRGLDPIDQQFWDEFQSFENIFGPADRPEDLLAAYQAGKRRPVPFQLISYEEFHYYIENKGVENQAWWRF